MPIHIYFVHRLNNKCEKLVDGQNEINKTNVKIVTVQLWFLHAWVRYQTNAQYIAEIWDQSWMKNCKQQY